MQSLRSFQAPPERTQLTARQVEAEGTKFGDEPVVAAGRFGLALEGAKLPTHLALKVLEPQEVLLARFEPALRALAAAAEFEHAGRLFDDHAAVFRTRLEHGVELALAHDHVLLAPDAGV